MRRRSAVSRSLVSGISGLAVYWFGFMV